MLAGPPNEELQLNFDQKLVGVDETGGLAHSLALLEYDSAGAWGEDVGGQPYDILASTGILSLTEM